MNALHRPKPTTFHESLALFEEGVALIRLSLGSLQVPAAERQKGLGKWCRGLDAIAERAAHMLRTGRMPCPNAEAEADKVEQQRLRVRLLLMGRQGLTELLSEVGGTLVYERAQLYRATRSIYELARFLKETPFAQLGIHRQQLADDVQRIDRLRAPRKDEPVRRATHFLREQLAAGPVRTAQLSEAARAQGITPRTLSRARQRVGIITYQEGGGWVCALPSQERDGEREGSGRR